MKTKLLKRLRREAIEAVPQPDLPFSESTLEWLISVIKWDDDFRDYILRWVAELKRKKK